MSEIPQKTIASFDRIKSIYLERRFNKSFVLLKRLFKDLDVLHKPKMKLNHTNYKYIEEAGKHFDRLTDHIQKKQVLGMISAFLKRFYRYLNFGLKNNQHDPIDVVSVQMTPQIFLSMYVIAGFPEFVLQAHHHQLEQPRNQVDYGYDVYVLANESIKSTNNAYNNENIGRDELRKLVKNYNMYSNCFNVFKSTDLLDKVNELLQRWSYTKETINQINDSKKYAKDQKEETLKVLNEQQEKIKYQILKLNPEFDEKYLDLYHQTSQKLEIQFKKAYWDKLRDDMNNDKYETVTKNILEIKEDLIKLRSKNKEYRLLVDKKLNVDEIVKLVKTNKSQDKLLPYFDFMVRAILLLSSPSRYEETKQLWTANKETIVNHEYPSIKEAMTESIQLIHGFLQDLKDDILNIYVMGSLGMNINELDKLQQEEKKKDQFDDEVLDEEIDDESDEDY